MLAFLPALILMLVKGPAHCERVACEGRLPAALAVLQHRIEAARPARAPSSVSADQAIFASLLRIGNSTDLRRAEVAKAFVELLRLTAPSTVEAPTEPEQGAARKLNCPSHPVGSESQGFFTCRRSRDGPLWA